MNNSQNTDKFKSIRSLRLGIDMSRQSSHTAELRIMQNLLNVFIIIFISLRH
jgi:hypothetical protein